MIAIDTNVLVQSFRSELPRHAAALALVSGSMNGTDDWAICWPSVHEFLAVVTRPRYVNPPTPMQAALQAVHQWRQSPSLRLLTEREDHFNRLEELLIPGGVIGGAIHDARIAAICLSHGVESIVTLDRDFSRFPQLPTRGL